MAIATHIIWIFLVLYLLAAAGGIILQIYLSGKESRMAGLLLPLLTFIYSLIMVFSLTVPENMSAWGIIGYMLGTLAAGNISTLILLAIYFTRREKIKKRKQLDKMNIQDL